MDELKRWQTISRHTISPIADRIAFMDKKMLIFTAVLLLQATSVLKANAFESKQECFEGMKKIFNQSPDDNFPECQKQKKEAINTTCNYYYNKMHEKNISRTYIDLYFSCRKHYKEKHERIEEMKQACKEVCKEVCQK